MPGSASGTSPGQVEHVSRWSQLISPPAMPLFLTLSHTFSHPSLPPSPVVDMSLCISQKSSLMERPTLPEVSQRLQGNAMPSDSSIQFDTGPSLKSTDNPSLIVGYAA